MTIKLGVIMDPLHKIHYKKDSTLAMLWEAERRGWEIYYLEQQDVYFSENKVLGRTRQLHVFQDPEAWYTLSEPETLPLAQLNIILMRKDPPFNMEYIYTTYLLELAEQTGVRIYNKPQSIRDCNEKFYTTYFPQCCPPTLITCDLTLLRNFIKEHKKIIIKPLDTMGGSGIFYLKEDDINISVALELLTQQGARFIMAQMFIPEIALGDKRIILINGKPVAYALARIPKQGELRGNLVAGARGVAQALTTRDQWICEQVGPTLREKGLMFVGLDVIGNYLTEINVTSPTGIRELENAQDLNISATLLDEIEASL